MSVNHPPKRLAVVLFNLGGPDCLESVRPFLFNLFSDPSILRVPSPLRNSLAWVISFLRTSKAQNIYRQLGGKSPLLEETFKQAHLLEELLKKEKEVKVFPCMRYWHPRAQQVIEEVRCFQPDHVVLLPLYPQFSTTTTQSSFKEWFEKAQHLSIPTSWVCCYPLDPLFIQAHVDLIRPYLEKKPSKEVNLLFSAHGLPQKIVEEGDPYPLQVTQTVQAIVAGLEKEDLSFQASLCYQSRVGPLKWLTPSLEDKLKEVASLKKPVVVVPVSFVSEHCETLVELDQEYRQKAENLGIPHYVRVPALGDHPLYGQALSHQVEKALSFQDHARKGCRAPQCFIKG